MPVKTSSTITLVVLIVASIIGLGMLTAADDLERASDDLHDRAEGTYGEDYKIVSSSECWDYCVMTATTADQQKSDILYTLQRRGGYVSEQQLRNNMVGSTLPEDTLQQLVDSGEVKERAEGDLITTKSFKYTGDAETTAVLSDAIVRERVHRHLYLTAASMSADAIAKDLPVGESRVQVALRSLEASGDVDGGYASAGLFTTEYKWIDTRHGSLPDSWFHQFQPVLESAILLALITGIAILITYFRDVDTPEAGGDA